MAKIEKRSGITFIELDEGDKTNVITPAFKQADGTMKVGNFRFIPKGHPADPLKEGQTLELTGPDGKPETVIIPGLE